jgi:hypothetical protein
VRGLGQEVEHRPAGQLGLPPPPGRQGLGPPVRESVVEHDEQFQRPGGQDLDVPFLGGPGDLHALGHVSSSRLQLPILGRAVGKARRGRRELEFTGKRPWYAY